MSDIRLPKINKAMLSGRIANDLELRYTASGKAFVRFSIAVDDNYKDTNGTWQDRAYFINCVAWDKQAEQINSNAHKGSVIIVEGKVTVSQYEDKDKVKKTDTSIVCSYIQILDKKASGEQTDTPAPTPIRTDDDVPF